MAQDPDALSDWTVRHSQRTSSDFGSPGVDRRTFSDNSLTAHLLAPASEGQPETWARRGSRPANLDVTAAWHTRGTGTFNRPIGEPSQTPEQWDQVQPRVEHNDRTDLGIHQARLFVPPEQSQPNVIWARSTQEHSKRVGTALGILQNEATDRGLGRISEQADPDLSPHSARMVAKLTGREHTQTNEMDFYRPQDPSRDTVTLPRAESEMGPRFTEVGKGYQTDTTILTKGEANLGLNRFRVAMAESPSGQARAAKRSAQKRETGPQYEQLDLLNQSE